jgi:hypothetical protein
MSVPAASQRRTTAASVMAAPSHGAFTPAASALVGSVFGSLRKGHDGLPFPRCHLVASRMRESGLDRCPRSES